MSRLGPIAAALAAAAALSACSTVARVGGMFDGEAAPAQTAPEDGRISILTFEQALTPDPALAGRTVIVPPAAPAGDWNQPGGTVDNSPIHIAGTAALDVAWRASLGAGSDRRVRLAAPPVISEGKLFFLDADHRVHAVDANNGDRLWTRELRPTEGEDRRARGGGVAASAGRVFVTTGFGFAVALNASDGEEVWRAQAGAPFHAAPTAAGGRVYAVTNDSELVAFDAGNGDVEWTYQAIAEPARILSASSPAVEGDTVIAPFASGEMIALISANGRRLWVDSLSRSGRLTSLSSINDIAGRPVIDNGVVYAASHSGLLAAVDVRTGTRIWGRAFASTQTPWIAGDVLYAVNIDGELVALDKTTGGVFWVRQLRRYEDEEDREGRISWTGPILVGGKLVLANSLGEVVSVTPETGEVAATADLDKPIFIPPIAANGSIYLVTDDAKLVVLR
jgi:outer membrane protein assembly factor BamB